MSNEIFIDGDIGGPFILIARGSVIIHRDNSALTAQQQTNYNVFSLMNTVDARRAHRECNIVARHTKSMTSTIR